MLKSVESATHGSCNGKGSLRAGVGVGLLLLPSVMTLTVGDVEQRAVRGVHVT